uniref:Uncharacterized protein n=1 Tax=Glossina brevipalpis TaxID=37001 RepID=A0A1A9WE00_9MUSC
MFGIIITNLEVSNLTYFSMETCRFETTDCKKHSVRSIQFQQEKNETPQYYLTQYKDNSDFVILRFHDGSPLREVIACKIVNGNSNRQQVKILIIYIQFNVISLLRLIKRIQSYCGNLFNLLQHLGQKIMVDGALRNIILELEVKTIVNDIEDSKKQIME